MITCVIDSQKELKLVQATMNITPEVRALEQLVFHFHTVLVLSNVVVPKFVKCKISKKYCCKNTNMKNTKHNSFHVKLYKN